MGFDVYGMKPKKNEVNMDDFRVYSKYNAMSFKDKWKELDKDKDLRKQFWEEQEAWENVQPGVYFRNNVWWWRPLWSYVCEVCEDILTEEDMSMGCENSGHLINEKKSMKIGVKLQALIISGATQQYETSYKAGLDALEQVECDLCDGTGKRKDMEVKNGCNKCHGKGRVDDWAMSYPFHTDNVDRFSEFCLQSGGFEIS
jgi:hypothetical protein